MPNLSDQQLAQGYIDFCTKVNALVAKFNDVANRELAEDVKPVSITANLEDLFALNDDFKEKLKASLLRMTMPQKIDALKEIFGEIVDLGMEAVQETTLGSLPASPAIDRMNYVLDVMNDDDLDFAVELVRNDEIENNAIWADVKKHRDDVSKQLRGHLPELIGRLEA